MERLNLLFQKGRVSPDYYENQYEKLERSLRYESKRQEALPMQPPAKEEKTVSGNWKTLYKLLDYEHRKCFWRSILAEITIDRETHQICGFQLLADRYGGRFS